MTIFTTPFCAVLPGGASIFTEYAGSARATAGAPSTQETRPRIKNLCIGSPRPFDDTLRVELPFKMQRAQQLGRYQLLDRIAFGGMAEIYRAKTFDQDGRAHLVAVKKVLQHLTTDEDFLRMLVDEAKLTALLTHENIAQVYELASLNGQTGDEY